MYYLVFRNAMMILSAMLLVLIIFYLAKMVHIAKSQSSNFDDREIPGCSNNIDNEMENTYTSYNNNLYNFRKKSVVSTTNNRIRTYLQYVASNEISSNFFYLKSHVNVVKEGDKQNGIEFDMRKREDAYDKSDPKQNPYALCLIITSYDDKVKGICSGSLLTDEWVLTAAHCVPDTSGDKIYVYAGGKSAEEAKGNIKNKQDLPSGSQLILFEKNFVDDTGLDIALVKLSKKFNLTDTVNTIKLSTKPWKHHSYHKCATTGFGNVFTSRKHNDDFSRKTQELEVKQPCLCSFWLNLKGMSSVDYLCAKPRQDYGVCFGDSGGGLVCDGKVVAVNKLILNFEDVTYCEINPLWRLLRIDGRPITCGGKNVLSAFQAVCPSLPWINDHVNLYTDEEILECRNISTNCCGSLSIFNYWFSLTTMLILSIVG